MKPTVYVETTIASYLTARPSRGKIIRAHQALTKQWWEERGPDFHLFTSQFAVDEAGDGDPDYAARRLSVLGALRLLAIGDPVVPLAQRGGTAALSPAGRASPGRRDDEWYRIPPDLELHAPRQCVVMA